MSNELTPWFHESVTPVHVGVYQTRLVLEGGKLAVKNYSAWDGRKWMDSCLDVESAAKTKIFGLPKRWRGLAKEPK